MLRFGIIAVVVYGVIQCVNDPPLASSNYYRAQQITDDIARAIDDHNRRASSPVLLRLREALSNE